MTTALLADRALERAYLCLLSQCQLPADHVRSHLNSPHRLAPSDCSDLGHTRILAAIHAAHDGGDPVDTLTTRLALVFAKAPHSLLTAFDEMNAGEVGTTDLRGVAGRLAQLATLRRAREHLLRGVVEAEREHLEGAREGAREALADDSGPTTIQPITAHQATLAASAGVGVPGEMRVEPARSGYHYLDHAITGLPPATMATVGGRSGCGKSSLMLGMAMNQAQHMGYRPGIVSCEDADVIWGGRVLARLCSVDPEAMLANQLDHKGVAHLQQGIDAAREINLHFAFALNQSLDHVLAAVRALIAKRCNVIYVDYLQAIRFGTNGKRAELVADAAQRLKALCQAHRVPLVLGSQLSRPLKEKPYAEPHYSELKESGDLENMSEIILLLWKSGDDESAQMLGKVAKIKWSGRRPRFELRLGPTGALQDIAPYTPPKPPTKEVNSWQSRD